jgi:hypothetical protein
VSDPWRHFTADAIAAASACPVANVREHWPRMVAQLEHALIADRPVQVAVIGTTAIESASSFAPVKEGFYLGEPHAEAHRRTLSYYPFYGRGQLQLTHEGNYRTYGKKVAQLWGAGPDDPSFDLVKHPDNALDPDIAAAVMALYFRDTRALPTASWPGGYGLVDAARANDWEWVRRLVYGGPDPKGAARIAQIAADLGSATATLAYDPGQPPERQIADWVCSIRATAWMLKSMGLPVDIGALQDEMVPEYVTPELGLLDARGHGIAEVLKAHLPAEWGSKVHVFERISWDELWSLAGRGPVALGLRGAYHWINVARQRPDGMLDSPNPAPNYPREGAIGDVLARDEFDRYGPSSAVWINAEAHAAPPDHPQPSLPTREEIDAIRADIDSQLAEIRARLPA